MKPRDVDFILERFDQTAPVLKRQIMAKFVEKVGLLEAENAKLRELLTESRAYSDHMAGCGLHDWTKCTCGLEEWRRKVQAV